MNLNLNSSALNLGKKKFSSQTKFLHYFSHKDAEVHHTIPVFENFAFALALLRSKEIDNIELAIDILDRLLKFQTSSGSFPSFVHQYPLDHLYLKDIDILNTFYWIGKEFKKVMPSSLKEALERSISLLIDFCDSKKSYFPQSSLFRFDLLKSVIKGSTFNFEENFDPLFLNSKEGLKDVFLSLQVFDLENSKKISKDIWKDSLNLFHAKLHSYIGPPANIFQNKYKEDLHISDLFFFSLLKAEKALDLDDPVFLYASLIRPILNLDLLKRQNDPSIFTFTQYNYRRPASFEDSFQEISEQSVDEEISLKNNPENDQKNWISLQSSNFSITTLEKTLPIDKRLFGFHLFKAIFGGLNTSSLVCQHFEGHFSSKVMDNDTVLLEFILPEGSKEDEFEIKFFTENHNCDILVNDTKATAFSFGDKLTLKNNKAQVDLVFELLDTQSKFCGHILRGNRPSQLSSRKDKFEAFDYLISLRTIHRLPNCKIKALLKFS